MSTHGGGVSVPEMVKITATGPDTGADLLMGMVGAETA